jgi:adenylate cyclase
VVFQDGDVYGRTVNVASRIADLAEASDVLTAEECVRQVEDDQIEWERVGSVELKGLLEPVILYRASRHP